MADDQTMDEREQQLGRIASRVSLHTRPPARIMLNAQDDPEPRRRLAEIMQWHKVTLLGNEVDAMSFTGCWMAFIAVSLPLCYLCTYFSRLTGQYLTYKSVIKSVSDSAIR